MSRRRPNAGLLTLVVESDWKVSAVVGLLAFVVGVGLLPLLLSTNRFLVGLVPLVRTVGWVFSLFFAMTALVKWLLASNAHAGRQGKSRVSKPSRPVGKPGVSQRLEPTALDKAWEPTAFSEREALPEDPTEWSDEVFDRLEWKRFEDLCCAFYREKGIRAEVTPLGPDGGIDISLHQDEAAPDRVTAIVQCKAWSQAVGVKPVRELRGVMAHKQVEKAFFMAPHGFTEDARAFAKENRIILLDAKLILAMIQRLPEVARKRLLTMATAGDWTTPSCPNCGKKMVVRESKRGRFWGCPAYPHCRGLLQMRGGTTTV